MAFNSFRFLLFYLIVVIAYFSISHKYRWILLLISSYYFYLCWNIKYSLLIIFSTLVTFFAGILISQAKNIYWKKTYLSFSIFSNLFILVLFKYFNFINDSIIQISEYFNFAYNIRDLHFLLPVGISFYTFQSLSYTIDVYRGNKEPEHHLGIYALYVSFFPQLVAGPIERSTRLIPQFYQIIVV